MAAVCDRATPEGAYRFHDYLKEASPADRVAVLLLSEPLESGRLQDAVKTEQFILLDLKGYSGVPPEASFKALREKLHTISQAVGAAIKAQTGTDIPDLEFYLEEVLAETFHSVNKLDFSSPLALKVEMEKGRLNRILVLGAAYKNPSYLQSVIEEAKKSGFGAVYIIRLSQVMQRSGWTYEMSKLEVLGRPVADVTEIRPPAAARAAMNLGGPDTPAAALMAGARLAGVREGIDRRKFLVWSLAALAGTGGALLLAKYLPSTAPKAIPTPIPPATPPVASPVQPKPEKPAVDLSLVGDAYFRKQLQDRLDYERYFAEVEPFVALASVSPQIMSPDDRDENIARLKAFIAGPVFKEFVEGKTELVTLVEAMTRAVKLPLTASELLSRVKFLGKLHAAMEMTENPENEPRQIVAPNRNENDPARYGEALGRYQIEYGSAVDFIWRSYKLNSPGGKRLINYFVEKGWVKRSVIERLKEAGQDQEKDGKRRSVKGAPAWLKQELIKNEELQRLIVRLMIYFYGPPVTNEAEGVKWYKNTFNPAPGATPYYLIQAHLIALRGVYDRRMQDVIVHWQDAADALRQRKDVIQHEFRRFKEDWKKAWDRIEISRRRVRGTLTADRYKTEIADLTAHDGKLRRWARPEIYLAMDLSSAFTRAEINEIYQKFLRDIREAREGEEIREGENKKMENGLQPLVAEYHKKWGELKRKAASRRKSGARLTDNRSEPGALAQADMRIFLQTIQKLDGISMADHKASAEIVSGLRKVSVIDNLSEFRKMYFATRPMRADLKQPPVIHTPQDLLVYMVTAGHAALILKWTVLAEGYLKGDKAPYESMMQTVENKPGSALLWSPPIASRLSVTDYQSLFAGELNHSLNNKFAPIVLQANVMQFSNVIDPLSINSLAAYVGAVEKYRNQWAPDGRPAADFFYDAVSGSLFTALTPGYERKLESFLNKRKPVDISVEEFERNSIHWLSPEELAQINFIPVLGKIDAALVSLRGHLVAIQSKTDKSVDADANKYLSGIQQTVHWLAYDIRSYLYRPPDFTDEEEKKAKTLARDLGAFLRPTLSYYRDHVNIEADATLVVDYIEGKSAEIRRHHKTKAAYGSYGEKVFVASIDAYLQRKISFTEFVYLLDRLELYSRPETATVFMSPAESQGRALIHLSKIPVQAARMAMPILLGRREEMRAASRLARRDLRILTRTLRRNEFRIVKPSFEAGMTLRVLPDDDAPYSLLPPGSRLTQPTADSTDLAQLSDAERSLVEQVVVLSGMEGDSIKPLELEIAGLRYKTFLSWQKTEEDGLLIRLHPSESVDVNDPDSVTETYILTKDQILAIRQKGGATVSSQILKTTLQTSDDFKFLALKKQLERLNRLAGNVPLVFKDGQKVIVRMIQEDNFDGRPSKVFDAFMKDIKPLLNMYEGHLFVEMVRNGAVENPQTNPEGALIILMGDATDKNVRLAQSMKAGLTPVNARIGDKDDDKDDIPVMANQANLVLAIGIALLEADEMGDLKNTLSLERLSQLHSELVDYTQRPFIRDAQNRLTNFQAMKTPKLGNLNRLVKLLIQPLARLNLSELLRLAASRLAAIGTSA